MSTTANKPREVNFFTDYPALLRCAFNQVCDPQDWKGPIDCIVPWDGANIYMQAIQFMTGVKPTFVKIGDNARLTCIGYRAGPAGDH